MTGWHIVKITQSILSVLKPALSWWQSNILLSCIPHQSLRTEGLLFFWSFQKLQKNILIKALHFSEILIFVFWISYFWLLRTACLRKFGRFFIFIFLFKAKFLVWENLNKFFYLSFYPFYPNGMYIFLSWNYRSIIITYQLLYHCVTDNQIKPLNLSLILSWYQHNFGTVLTSRWKIVY